MRTLQFSYDPEDARSVAECLVWLGEAVAGVAGEIPPYRGPDLANVQHIHVQCDPFDLEDVDRAYKVGVSVVMQLAGLKFALEHRCIACKQSLGEGDWKHDGHADWVHLCPVAPDAGYKRPRWEPRPQVEDTQAADVAAFQHPEAPPVARLSSCEGGLPGQHAEA